MLSHLNHPQTFRHPGFCLDGWEGEGGRRGPCDRTVGRGSFVPRHVQDRPGAGVSWECII